jgi:hypothetical protein
MSQTDPYVYLQQAAARMRDPEALKEKKDVETLLDEVEYLYDGIDPDMQDGVDQLIAQLRARLASFS